MAEKFSARPSEIIGLQCDIQAFYLDRACWMYGTQLDSKIDQAANAAKNDVGRQTAVSQVMNKALNQGRIEGPTKGSKAQFRDPALM